MAVLLFKAIYTYANGTFWNPVMLLHQPLLRWKAPIYVSHRVAWLGFLIDWLNLLHFDSCKQFHNSIIGQLSLMLKIV